MILSREIIACAITNPYSYTFVYLGDENGVDLGVMFKVL